MNKAFIYVILTENQPFSKTNFMDLNRYSKLKKPKIFSKEMDLADQIYEYFKKKLDFPLIMKLIKTKGYQFIWECFSEARQSDFPHKLELFLSLVGKTKIRWMDENE